MDRFEMLRNLQFEWEIKSVTSHTNGYWDSGPSFDMRELMWEEDVSLNGDGALYLSVNNGQLNIRIAGDESFYVVDKMDKNELSLTCYFKPKYSGENQTDLIKLITFLLRRN